jgi:hypothetical protein
MTIDPLHILSFNMHAQPGTYALLLGSGVSRAAGIPTGYEVTLDLIRKLAAAEGKDCGDDPASWFKNTHGLEASYTNVVARLAPTTTLQQQLLKAYFEANDDERAQGLKVPTAAHRAVARLVRMGYVRVIVTTNFDRLMENALRSEGVEPTIIQHAEDIDGAPGLSHSACTVIKLHGDYLDTRIRNSPTALDQYDPRVDALLDRVFGDFGLVVCGWSAEYDTALSRSIRRTSARRYPMVWASIYPPGQAATDLITSRSALTITIGGADAFFSALSEMLRALNDFSRPHPLSKTATEVLLKRFLSSNEHRIQLRDLMIDETERCLNSLTEVWKALESGAPSQGVVAIHLQRIQGACETLCSLFATASYYSGPDNLPAFRDALKLLAGHEWSTGGYVFWESLQKYPLLLVLYSIGVAASASGNYTMLSDVASVPAYRSRIQRGVEPLAAILDAHEVMDIDNGKSMLAGKKNRKTPFNDYLLEVITNVLSPIIRDKNILEDAFGLFEYLWALIRIHYRAERGEEVRWVAVGRFIWAGRQAYSNELERNMDKKSPMLSAGLFGGDVVALKRVHAQAEKMLQEQAKYFY